jgi:hypothetical protein
MTTELLFATPPPPSLALPFHHSAPFRLITFSNRFIVLATDGVWDYMSEEVVADVVMKVSLSCTFPLSTFLPAWNYAILSL